MCRTSETETSRNRTKRPSTCRVRYSLATRVMPAQSDAVKEGTVRRWIHSHVSRTGELNPMNGRSHSRITAGLAIEITPRRAGTFEALGLL